MAELCVNKMIGVLQRDRLSDFIKESHNVESGCFYYALINCHNYFYPRDLLPRDFYEKIKLRNNLGIWDREVVGEVKRLEPDLKMRVECILNHSVTPIERVAEILNLSKEDEVPLVNSPACIDIFNLKTPSLILLQDKIDSLEAHFISSVKNNRFGEWDEVKGGLDGYKTLMNDYSVLCSFVLERS